MEKNYILNTKDRWYIPFRTIYNSSFPLHEQRTEEQQIKAFAHPAYRLQIITENENLLSFISYWEFDSYIYIEHLAVNPEFRGNNRGSQLLQDFTSGQPKTVLLEIDPLIDDISHRRFEFYKRNGFYDNPYPHFHPPYRQEFSAHELIVLSHSKQISRKEYEQFKTDLEEVVMKF
ncbi:MAG: GNAT family N-acetyltransferase [Tannerellaceae bacterium]|nr:GNAT family N-acetyltransferase [Tannerellaceae bacterium]